MKSRKLLFILAGILISSSGCTLEEPPEIHQYPCLNSEGDSFQYIIPVMTSEELSDAKQQIGKILYEKNGAPAEYELNFRIGHCPKGFACVIEQPLPDNENIEFPEGWTGDKNANATYCIMGGCPIGTNAKNDHSTNSNEELHCEADRPQRCGQRAEDCTKLDGWIDGICYRGECKVTQCDTEGGYYLSKVKNRCVYLDQCCGRFCANCQSKDVNMVCDPIAGECADTCPDGLVACSADLYTALDANDGKKLAFRSCVDPMTDPSWCGARQLEVGKGRFSRECYDFTVCTADQVCSGGRCVEPCEAGKLLIDGQCINIEEDNSFCGQLSSDHKDKIDNKVECVYSSTDDSEDKTLTCTLKQVDAGEQIDVGQTTEPDEDETDEDETDEEGDDEETPASAPTTSTVVIQVKSCAKNQICSAGSCTDVTESQCQSPNVFCDGKCIDPKTDFELCGTDESCTNSLMPSEMDECVDGVYEYKCQEGFTRCGKDCVDLLTDKDNCNECGVQCDFCDNGNCIVNVPQNSEDAKSGSVWCMGGWRDPKNDDNFCGIAWSEVNGVRVCHYPSDPEEKDKVLCAANQVCWNGKCVDKCKIDEDKVNAINWTVSHANLSEFNSQVKEAYRCFDEENDYIKQNWVVCGGKYVDPKNDKDYCGAVIVNSDSGNTPSGTVEGNDNGQKNAATSVDLVSLLGPDNYALVKDLKVCRYQKCEGEGTTCVNGECVAGCAEDEVQCVDTHECLSKTSQTYCLLQMMMSDIVSGSTEIPENIEYHCNSEQFGVSTDSSSILRPLEEVKCSENQVCRISEEDSKTQASCVNVSEFCSSTGCKCPTGWVVRSDGSNPKCEKESDSSCGEEAKDCTLNEMICVNHACSCSVGSTPCGSAGSQTCHKDSEQACGCSENVCNQGEFCVFGNCQKGSNGSPCSDNMDLWYKDDQDKSWCLNISGWYNELSACPGGLYDTYQQICASDKTCNTTSSQVACTDKCKEHEMVCPKTADPAICTPGECIDPNLDTTCYSNNGVDSRLENCELSGKECFRGICENKCPQGQCRYANSDGSSSGCVNPLENPAHCGKTCDQMVDCADGLMCKLGVCVQKCDVTENVSQCVRACCTGDKTCNASGVCE